MTVNELINALYDFDGNDAVVVWDAKTDTIYEVEDVTDGSPGEVSLSVNY